MQRRTMATFARVCRDESASPQWGSHPGYTPVLKNGVPTDLAHYADPMPQALVLTAIVIGFAMTALFLVVLLASRGSSGNDHVDGVHSRTEQEML